MWLSEQDSNQITVLDLLSLTWILGPVRGSGSGIAPGGDLTPSNLLDWENWRKKVLAGKKIPPPQATVFNSDHRLHATPGSEE